MRDLDPKRETRERLELQLAEVVIQLRKHHGEGNMTLRVPDTGDFVAVLQITLAETQQLEAMLRGWH